MSLNISGSQITFSDGSTQNTAPNGSFKNRIINGAMMIDQRNAGASVSPANAYSLDRWYAYTIAGSKFTVQQNAGSVTPPTGFSNYLGVTSSTALSLGVGDYYNLQQSIEGFNTSDFNFGTASAATVTLSFWVRSSLTGTFGGALMNSAESRSYPFTYVINAANTWEQKSVTIAGDTTGTWIGSTNGIGLRVCFNLATGSNYTATAGSWTSGFRFPTGATNVLTTNGATFYITGVQLEKGSTATSFDYRPYGTELALCQRYCNVIKPATVSSGMFSGVWYNTTGVLHSFMYPVQMRSAPTLSVSAASDFGIVSSGNVDAANAVSLAGSSSVSTRIDFTSSSARTAGQGSVVQAANTSASLTFSAEL